MADADDLDDDMDEEEEAPSGGGRKFKFSINLQPFWAAIGRVLWMGAVGVIVMGTYVVGTRYDLEGYRKPFRIDRITGKVTAVSESSQPKTAPGGFLLEKYYLSPQQIKALKKLADSQKRDVNEVAREAIDTYLRGRKSDSDKKKREKRRKPDL